MPDWLQEYYEQLKELTGNLSRKAKITIGIGAAAVILFLLFLIIFSGNVRYQPLFSQLAPKDADAIVNKLEDAGIPYRLTEGGQTILVPADQVHKTRLDMAGAGLPSQGIVGFEIFDKTNFGTTDFERKVNYYRALGGELSRSIMAMDGVEFARVQISAPKESLFVEEDKPAVASVLLKLRPGDRLGNTQVMAIANLVASSVQQLEPAQVTIVDTAGNLLTSGGSEDSPDSSNLTGNQFAIQQQFEDALKSDLRVMLTKVVGPGNFTLQVKAKLNFDQREVESTAYSPVVGDEGIARSRQEQLENYQGSEGAAQGSPGNTSNIPQYQAQNNDQNGNYEKSNIITNYEINKRIEKHVYAPGEVESLSVAIIVNDAVAINGVQKIRDVIQAAIGYNPDRGDQVTVTSLAFDNSIEQEIAQAEAAAQNAEKTRMYIYAGLIGLILIILTIIILTLRRSPEIAVEEEVAPGQTPRRAIDFMVGDEQAQEQMAASESRMELSEEDRKRQQLKEEIANSISEKPEEVAQLLRSWLMED